jgi:hypothetical protein
LLAAPTNAVQFYLFEPRDRVGVLLENSTLNGIDFVEVASDDQKTLRVHFLN